MEGIKSIKEILAILKKRLLLILMVSIGAGIVSGLYTNYKITPLYQSSSQLLVNKNIEKVVDVSELDVRSNMDLIDTYIVIIRNPVILNDVVEKLQLPITGEQLSSQIQVAKQDSTQVLNVTTTDTDPERAAEITNTTVNTFLEKLPSLMKVNNVQIMNEAKENSNPISPNMMVNVGIAVALGAIIGIGLVLLFAFLDTTVRSKADLEKLNIKVVGTLSTIYERDRIPHSLMQSLKAERRSLNVTTTKTEF
ncbi:MULTISPECIES: YveK family protein [Bacillaceae]|uniref:YveK family protein n=1 Tax=Bacillaceae TaxID=186817 RepID=UPI0004E22F45|nr:MULTISPECIES: Wzz/FepE/Etk N-terminal domain-containing protein [Bacillaceae]MCF2649164.1 capsular biosynthesis protein [Niallia circulans]